MRFIYEAEASSPEESRLATSRHEGIMADISLIMAFSSPNSFPDTPAA
jgi:hypothetical protein